MKFISDLLRDGGPNVSRAINLGVFFVLSIGMMKLTWNVDDVATDVGMWYWACFTTLAVYGCGVHTFNKVIDAAIQIKSGRNDKPAD